MHVVIPPTRVDVGHVPVAAVPKGVFSSADVHALAGIGIVIVIVMLPVVVDGLINCVLVYAANCATTTRAAVAGSIEIMTLSVVAVEVAAKLGVGVVPVTAISAHVSGMEFVRADSEPGTTAAAAAHLSCFKGIAVVSAAVLRTGVIPFAVITPFVGESVVPVLTGISVLDLDQVVRLARKRLDPRMSIFFLVFCFGQHPNLDLTVGTGLGPDICALNFARVE